MTWFDLSSQSWQSHHTTKVLFEHGNYDYYDFFDSFNGEGFSLLINMAQGGVMPGQSTLTGNKIFIKAFHGPGTHDTFVDGQPQYMTVSSVKVYGF